jgi:hypothetical protein
MRLLALILTLLPAAAMSADMTVFGLKLGEPLALPECHWNDSLRVYGPATNGPCMTYGRYTDRRDPASSERRIEFPYSQRPSLSARSYVIGTVINGKLEAVTVPTRGINAIRPTMEALQAKYGEPTSVRTYPVRNRAGAQFESANATWEFADLSVVYLGSVGVLDAGEIVIATPTGIAERERQHKESTRDRRPL